MAKEPYLLSCFINDVDYKISNTVKGKTTLDAFYLVWNNLKIRSTSRERAFGKAAYKNCTVSSEWLKFSNFKAWMLEQPWQGMYLDKDILIQGNKEYGPNTCRFVPVKINNLLLACKLAGDQCPIGVSKAGTGKFQARICSFLENKRIHLGNFADPKLAHKAWQLAKADIIQDAINWWATDAEVSKSFQTDVADALMMRAWKLRKQASCGEETLTI